MAIGLPSNLLHIMQLRKAFFTVALPFIIQYVSHVAFNVLLCHYEGLLKASAVWEAL